MQRDYGSYKESHGSIQKNYTTQNLYKQYKSYKTSGYLFNNYYDRTSLFPHCNAKEAPIPVMPNYDPRAAQHNDQAKCIIAGTSQKVLTKQQGTNTYMSVINDLIIIRIIEQVDRPQHSKTIKILIICLSTSIYSRFLFQNF